MMKKLCTLFTFTILILLFSQNIYSQNDSTAKNILVVLGDYYGPNTYFNLHYFESFGWDVTTTAIEQSVQPCSYYNLPDIAVDIQLESITDISLFDAIAIQPAQFRQNATYTEIINNQHALNLVHQADSINIPIYATCSGVRVLAYADVINGIQVQGNDFFVQEYIDAGATYVGSQLLPVIDSNIVTTTRGQYYQSINCEAIEGLIETLDTIITKSSANIRTDNDKIDDELIWDKTIGTVYSEGFQNIIPLSEGGFAACGYSYASQTGNPHVQLIKFDDNGNANLTMYYGGLRRDYAYDLKQTNDQGFIIAGYSTSFDNNKQMYLIKTDSQGTIEWQKTYGGNLDEEARGVTIANDGGYLVCGFTNSFGSGEFDVYVIRTDPYGDTLWTKTIGGAAFDRGYDCLTLEDGFALVGGTGSYGAGNMDLYMIKLDNTGNIVWENTSGSGGFNFERGLDIQLTPDNTLVAVGQGSSSGDGSDIYLVTADLSGNLLLSKKIGNNVVHDFGFGVHPCNDGGFLIGGKTVNATNANFEGYIVKINAQGLTVWEKIIEKEGSDGINAICEASDGYILAGQTNSFGSGRFDGWLLKIEEPLYCFFTEDITFGQAPLEVNFTDYSSSNVTSWEWDFNHAGVIDSYEQSPTYTFTEAGNYSVQLVVSDGSHSDTVLKENLIHVTSINTEEISLNKNIMICYPTPFNESVTIKFKVRNHEEAEIKVIDLYGKEVKNFGLYKAGDYEIKWEGDTNEKGNISTGIYYVMLRTETKLLYKKIIRL
jgi:hypothetical protein